MTKVLITGGSGFIGTHLTRLLKLKGYHVEHLGRTRHSKAGVKTWLWDVNKQYIEDGAFNMGNHDGFYLVHLAGEGIADKPWTEERKRSIVSSRTDTIKFLYSECARRNIFPQALVSAGGISCYGMVTADRIFTEEDPFSHDFIGHCCAEWEKAARLFEPFCPVSILRTPLVLDSTEGGLPRLDRKILGIRPVPGTGRQWLPWVHISDLCRAYAHAMENGLSGAYNVVAPTHLTYAGLIKEIDRARGSHFYIPFKVPVWLLKLVLGERYRLVTEGSRASGQKLAGTGFAFGFTEIGMALTDLYG